MGRQVHPGRAEAVRPDRRRACSLTDRVSGAGTEPARFCRPSSGRGAVQPDHRRRVILPSAGSAGPVPPTASAAWAVIRATRPAGARHHTGCRLGAGTITPTGRGRGPSSLHQPTRAQRAAWAGKTRQAEPAGGGSHGRCGPRYPRPAGTGRRLGWSGSVKPAWMAVGQQESGYRRPHPGGTSAQRQDTDGRGWAAESATWGPNRAFLVISGLSPNVIHRYLDFRVEKRSQEGTVLTHTA